VNPFLLAATVLMLGLVPCGIVCVRGRLMDAVVALELAGSVMVTILICLAEGFERPSYFNLPVVCALLVWVDGLIFARFLGRLVG
jgi:multicomponent Na+:H+ antiporter subunit F